MTGRSALGRRTPAGARRRQMRVRSMLVLVALLPAVGAGAAVTSSVSSLLARRDASREVREEVDSLVAVLDARVALADEGILSAVAALSSDLGFPRTGLDAALGTDFEADLDRARRAVDANATIDALPEIQDDLVRLRALRDQLDAGIPSFEDNGEVFDGLVAGVEVAWERHLSELRGALSADSLPATVSDRVDAVSATFETMSAANKRVTLLVELARGGGADQLGLLYEATGRQAAAERSGEEHLGPHASAAWSANQSDPAATRAQSLITAAMSELVAGTELSIDLAEYGEMLADFTRWLGNLSAVTHAAATDLSDEARRHERDASSALGNLVITFVVLSSVSLVGALLLSRLVTRPLQALEAAAHQIHDGRFDLDPIEPRGPREVSDTAIAFNEMAATLAMVESQAIALAEDPTAPELAQTIPGRTGRSLHQALSRVRTSIQDAEHSRQELEQVATHDGLTGLLNRSAALAMIDRDLAIAQRTGASLMALFIDLDGLKLLNDRYGHGVGDEAIRLTAAALTATTRDADVVARLGGDEFLVVGAIDDPEEAELLATRIRSAVTEQDLHGPAGPLLLRCSIGVVVSEPDEHSVDALINRADAALYVAKRRGRDQVYTG